jgi:threonine aldolase
LQQVSQFAQTRQIPIHLDGARIFNAAIALGVDPPAITRYVNSVQFCLSKGLAAPVGSMIVGDGTFIRRARGIRKMLGGGMRQAGIIAAAGIVALEQMIDRLYEDHRNAHRMAEGLARIPELQINLERVQTNIVIFRVIDDRFSWQSFIAAAHRRGLSLGEIGHGNIRAVFHYGVTEKHVDEALNIIEDVCHHGPD